MEAILGILQGKVCMLLSYACRFVCVTVCVCIRACVYVYNPDLLHYILKLHFHSFAIQVEVADMECNAVIETVLHLLTVLVIQLKKIPPV